jgi:signal peptidase II
MRLWVSGVVMVCLLTIDFASKVWIRASVPLYELTPLLPNFLDLTHVQNRGVSFSLLADLDDTFRLPLLIGTSTLAVAGMLYYQLRYWPTLDLWTQQGLTWILPGAIGNLIDRAWFGHVTDFFHFRWYDYSFFVNNLADCFISLGVVFFVAATFTAPTSQTS